MSDINSISKRLREAFTAVEQAEIPESLWQQAFVLAFDALENDGTESTPRTQTRRDGGGEKTKDRRKQDEIPGDGESPVDEESFFQQLARSSEVPELTLRDTFYISDGKPGINLRPQDLGSSNRERTQSLAVLMAGAYTLGVGATLSADSMIDVAKRIGCFDSNNHARFLRDLNASLSYTGPARSKEIRLKPAGESEFRRLLGITEE